MLGGSVTGVTLVNGTIRLPGYAAFQFGRQRDGRHCRRGDYSYGCNGNAAFSGNYTVQGLPAPRPLQYSADRRQSIVPGTTTSGNHCDDCVTTIALPFPYTLYDQTYNAINLSSNGNASAHDCGCCL